MKDDAANSQVSPPLAMGTPREAKSRNVLSCQHFRFCWPTPLVYFPCKSQEPLRFA
jgi:hypothetical protein